MLSSPSKASCFPKTGSRQCVGDILKCLGWTKKRFDLFGPVRHNPDYKIEQYAEVLWTSLDWSRKESLSTSVCLRLRQRLYAVRTSNIRGLSDLHL
ncbi:hypothetical protein BJV77DRAFT_1020565 [Russula vinacea]|nr:hypothetical protein BJV77DRAFT_1020565 [Russula vinacea]